MLNIETRYKPGENLSQWSACFASSHGCSVGGGIFIPNICKEMVIIVKKASDENGTPSFRKIAQDGNVIGMFSER